METELYLVTTLFEDNNLYAQVLGALIRKATYFLVNTYLQPWNSHSDGPSRCLKSFMVNLLIRKFMLLNWASNMKHECVYYTSELTALKINWPVRKSGKQLLLKEKLDPSQQKLETPNPENDTERTHERGITKKPEKVIFISIRSSYKSSYLWIATLTNPYTRRKPFDMHAEVFFPISCPAFSRASRLENETKRCVLTSGEKKCLWNSSQIQISMHLPLFCNVS